MAKGSAFEAKTHFGKLLDRVAKGEEIVITRHDKPVARVLAVLVRRGKLIEEERQAALGRLAALRTRVDHNASELAFNKLSELASAHQLSVYDATYLELAQRRRSIFGCKDGPLREAAKRCGISLWE